MRLADHPRVLRHLTDGHETLLKSIRKESDRMREVEVPGERLWGALNQFQVGNRPAGQSLLSGHTTRCFILRFFGIANAPNDQAIEEQINPKAAGGEDTMRSDLVFAARAYVSNAFLLTKLVSKATRKLHRPNTRIQDSTNDVLERCDRNNPMPECQHAGCWQPMRTGARADQNYAAPFRERNTRLYRLTHWLIWIWVFFLAPGWLTFDLFATGGSERNLLWLGAVLVGTGIAAFRGKLPGTEPAPYILRFDEDRPNTLYRKVCYTFAWNAVLSFALLNLAGLVDAVVNGRWHMMQIYRFGYFPLFAVILLLGMTGVLPRARRSTKGEGTDRPYFYGSVWAVTLAQTVLLILSKTLPRNHAADLVLLAMYVSVLGGVGIAAGLGLLPRTRPILPGKLMVAD